MASRPTDSPKKRRARHDGGLYKKTRRRRDPETGQEFRILYYEASWEIPLDRRKPGSPRSRVTGSGPTEAIARRNLERNKVAYLTETGRGHEVVKGIPKGAIPTFDTLVSKWFDERAKGKRSHDYVVKQKANFRLHISPHVGSLKITQVDRRKLALLFGDTLPKKRNDAGDNPLLGDAAIANIHRDLNSFLKWAVILGFIDNNPLATIDAPKPTTDTVDVNRYSALADDLIAKLRDNSDPDYCRWLIQFLGLRKAERLGLSWSSIENLDTDHAVLVVQQQLARKPGGGWELRGTKTGKERRIPLAEPFLSALREHKKAQDEIRALPSWKPARGKGFDDLVFTQKNGRFITLNSDNLHWHKVLERYGFPYWRGHINRHVTASRLAATDPPTPLNVVYSILGHDSDAIGYYYSKVMERQQVPAMATYGATFMASAKKPRRGRAR